MSISLTRKLEIYQRNLERYETSGDEQQAEIERRLIARLKAEQGE